MRPSKGLAYLLGVVVVCALLTSARLRPLVPRTAHALPLYAARSGRTCDNCHTDPTGWNNPRLALRKCNLSCATCHVNPTGGGIRNVVGRFYGQTTMPMLAASHRPAKDEIRHLANAFRSDTRRNRLPEPAWGKPIGGSPQLAYDEKRYAGLRADPALLVGLDFRLASWLIGGGALVFPMQFDVQLALHPTPYVTAYVNAGVLAKSQGFVPTFADGARRRNTPFMVKDVFAMVHQLPYMSYFRVGRFIPPFGVMVDDHTVATRREFELDQGLMQSRVFGGEFGLAPNYPYFHLAVFRPNRKDAFNEDSVAQSVDELPPFAGVLGWGMATSFGWRDLGYQVGVSAMLRRRDLAEGGNTEALSFNAAFNPWFYSDSVPLTLIGEFIVGGAQRGGSGQHIGQLAALLELSYLPFNGIGLRLRYDYGDPDTGVIDDHYSRIAFGLDLNLLPNIELSSWARLRIDRTSAGNATATPDGLIVLRAWY